jgi:hypothetical protein
MRVKHRPPDAKVPRRRRLMRELIGKLRTEIPNVTKNVYRDETVRCQNCGKIAPVGIEVVTVKTEGDSRKVLKHEYYCRAHAFDAHGVDYETRAQNRPIHKSD